MWSPEQRHSLVSSGDWRDLLRAQHRLPPCFSLQSMCAEVLVYPLTWPVEQVTALYTDWHSSLGSVDPFWLMTAGQAMGGSDALKFQSGFLRRSGTAGWSFVNSILGSLLRCVLLLLHLPLSARGQLSPPRGVTTRCCRRQYFQPFT